MKSPAEPSQGRRQASLRFIVICGMLVAVAAVFSYMEVLFPLSLAIPGVKLGLANIVVVFALYLLGLRAAILISLLRIVLVSSLFGNLMMALYSIAGALVSLLVMAGLKHSKLFSVTGVSMAGGAFHNIAQLSVAAFASGTVAVFSYMPVLIVVGMFTGILIGIVTDIILQRLAPLVRGRL